ncbi:MAG: C-GCAxxG-C-C family protein [Candidatus Heimdallarchaeota archaeon]
MTIEDINSRFDAKVKELEENLPDMKSGANCAELTLTSVLQVLNMDNYIFHNIIKPLAGGFGGYKSKEGWMGACGAVAGGCAAIGAILGGKELMDNDTMARAYITANRFAVDFETKFGSVVCSQLCGYDFSNPENYMKYREDSVWKKICYRFVVWAVDKIKNMTQQDLKDKWV